MKVTVSKTFPALFLAVVFLGMTPPALRAQLILWPYQTFDGNICGLNSSPAVTLAYDPMQDDTGNGGGSCHLSTDYSQSGDFQVFANNVCCCGCDVLVGLQLSNYNAVEFDVKWDNSSTVPLSYFNTNFGGGSQGIGIGIGPPDFDGFSSICQSNVIIPDAATNGWVHVSAPINHAGTNSSFIGLVFQKSFPAYGASNIAAFWLDNLELVGPTFILPVSQSSYEGGQFTFHFPAIRSATYSVFKSEDFMDWTTLVTGFPPGGAVSNATLSFTDTNANTSQGYYRIRSP
jgi:hypothetical protein